MTQQRFIWQKGLIIDSKQQVVSKLKFSHFSSDKYKYHKQYFSQIAFFRANAIQMGYTLCVVIQGEMEKLSINWHIVALSKWITPLISVTIVYRNICTHQGHVRYVCQSETQTFIYHFQTCKSLSPRLLRTEEQHFRVGVGNQMYCGHKRYEKPKQ